MTETSSVQNRMERLFVEELEVDVDFHADLIGSGALDSLLFVQLLTQLEQEFGVHVDVSELDLDIFTSVSRIARFVAGGEEKGAGP
jgi:acyl carrier protein